MNYIKDAIAAYKLGRMVLNASVDKQMKVISALLGENTTAIDKALREPPRWPQALGGKQSSNQITKIMKKL